MNNKRKMKKKKGNEKEIMAVHVRRTHQDRILRED
jgi:hypothetical protein